MIHLVGPVVLAAALTGIGVYGLIARRNAVLVLIGAEVLLNGVNVLLVTVAALPTGGLAAILDAPGPVQAGTADPLLAGQVLAIFVITIAAAEIGVALAVVLLLFRSRATSDLGAVRELGEASPTYTEYPGAGEWPDRPEPVEASPDGAAGPEADAGAAGDAAGDAVQSPEGAR